MNDNHKSIKGTFSNIRPSDECIERINNMTQNKTKRHFKLTPVLAAAMCIAIIVTGVIGGSGITARISSVFSGKSSNAFTITAYAKDNDGVKEIDLSKSSVTKTDLKIHYELIDGVLPSCSIGWTGFMVNGKDIESVTYRANHGSFDYQSLNGNDFDTYYSKSIYDSKLPYKSEITINELGDNEIMQVFYNPQEAVDTLLNSNEASFDYSTLPEDTITISVSFKDGSKAESEIRTSFDKEGYLQLEYIK